MGQKQKVKYNWQTGDMVWAKQTRFKHWPGEISSIDDVAPGLVDNISRAQKPGCQLVLFYPPEKQEYGWISEKNGNLLLPFRCDKFKEFSTPKLVQPAFAIALKTEAIRKAEGTLRSPEVIGGGRSNEDGEDEKKPAKKKKQMKVEKEVEDDEEEMEKEEDEEDYEEEQNLKDDEEEAYQEEKKSTKPKPKKKKEKTPEEEEAAAKKKEKAKRQRMEALAKKRQRESELDDEEMEEVKKPKKLKLKKDKSEDGDSDGRKVKKSKEKKEKKRKRSDDDDGERKKRRKEKSASKEKSEEENVPEKKKKKEKKPLTDHEAKKFRFHLSKSFADENYEMTLKLLGMIKKLDISVEILKESGIGKVVKQLTLNTKNDEVKAKAVDVLEFLMGVVASSHGK